MSRLVERQTRKVTAAGVQLPTTSSHAAPPSPPPPSASGYALPLPHTHTQRTHTHLAKADRDDYSRDTFAGPASLAQLSPAALAHLGPAERSQPTYSPGATELSAFNTLVSAFFSSSSQGVEEQTGKWPPGSEDVIALDAACTHQEILHWNGAKPAQIARSDTSRTKIEKNVDFTSPAAGGGSGLPGGRRALKRAVELTHLAADLISKEHFCDHKSVSTSPNPTGKRTLVSTLSMLC